MRLEQWFASFRSIIMHPWFIWAVIGLGIVIRLVVYMESRSFWTDEISLAMNIVELDLSQLHEPLRYGQAAPVLFLYLTKIISNIYGISELTLRFVPFLGGCLGLIVFYYLARDLLSRQAVLLAVLLLAFSRYSIYYSAEFKQYSTDLLCTAVILLIANKVYQSGYKISYIALLTVGGLISVWFSHTSIFIMAGSGLALFIEFVFNKDKHADNYNKILFPLVLMGIIWLGSFGLNYFLIVRDSAHGLFYDFWAGGFAPFLPVSFKDILWYSSTLTGIVSNPLGFSFFRGLAIFALLAGVYSLFKSKKYFYLYLLMLPLLFIMIASMLEQYPILSRLMLFVVPIFYLLIAEGLYLTYLALRKKHLILGAAVLIIFFAYPGFSSPVGHAIQLMAIPESRQRQEIKEVINYLLEHSQPSDVIYLYYGANRAFNYYTAGIELPNDVIYGSGSRGEPVKYLEELESLEKGKRYWFVFYHVHSGTVVNEEKLFVIYLNKIGEKLDVHKAKGASLYLYEIK